MRQKQFVWLDAQSQRQALQIVERDISDLTLDMSHKRPVQSSLEGQCLLGPPLLSA